MKGFVVAGTGSGIGKTTVTAALLAALAARGFKVQAFKSGPDYIDPAHHARLTRRPSYNLDTWMLPSETNRTIFAHAIQDADIAVVEGTMGLFDGASGVSASGSTAELAELIGLPVVLIVDASNVARSVAAIVKGFHVFDPSLRLGGVILNRVAGPAHFDLLQESIRQTGVPVIGWLPELPEVHLQERHLGLVTAAERSWTPQQVQLLARTAEENISLDTLLAGAEIVSQRGKLQADPFSSFSSEPLPERVRIGIARDLAFSFYYESSFDVLRAQGAELIDVSPLSDSALPRELDGLYIGGGYPEIYAEQLAANQSFLASLRDFVRDGHPVYGECGGLMYFAEELTTQGVSHRMASLLPLAIEMVDRLQDFGYTEVEVTQDCLIASRGTRMRGHSFHCSRVTRSGPIRLHYRTHRLLGAAENLEGYGEGSVFGSYIHLSFAACPESAARFVQRARQSRKAGMLP